MAMHSAGVSSNPVTAGPAVAPLPIAAARRLLHPTSIHSRQLFCGPNVSTVHKHTSNEGCVLSAAVPRSNAISFSSRDSIMCLHHTGSQQLGRARAVVSFALNTPANCSSTSPCQHSPHGSVIGAQLGLTYSCPHPWSPSHSMQARASSLTSPRAHRPKHSAAARASGSGLHSITDTAAGQQQQDATWLQELTVRDFALVAEQTVCFGPGLNVITGESGSGKSVLVEAFGQILGASAPAECIRHPAEMAVLEGTFMLSATTGIAARTLLSKEGLPGRGLPIGDGSELLSIRREIVQQGGTNRSRCFVNGAATSLRVLRALGGVLVDTNGQHAALSLRDSHTQLAMLDRLAGAAPLVAAFTASLEALQAVEGKLEELEQMADEEERGRLQRLCDLVRKVRVLPGEERDIRADLKRMETRRGIVESCSIARMAISGTGDGGGGGVVDALRNVEEQFNMILMREEQLAPEPPLPQLQPTYPATAGVSRPSSSSNSVVGEAASGSLGSGSSLLSSDFSTSSYGHSDALEGEEGEAVAVDVDALIEDPEVKAAREGAEMLSNALYMVAQARQMLSKAESQVKAYARLHLYSASDAEDLRERLQRLEKLMKAHGVSSTEALLAKAAAAEVQLEQYYDMEGNQEKWEAEAELLEAEVLRHALALSKQRRVAAGQLRGAVEGCLKELAMANSRFDVRVSWEALPEDSHRCLLHVPPETAAAAFEQGDLNYALYNSGLDRVEFLLAAGPSEPLRPLSATASGGESARIMLALKAAPATVAAALAAEVDGSDNAPGAVTPSTSSGVPIMILDELDSGMGARLGNAVGQILHRMTAPPAGTNSQIICVTHLPQVACHADRHIKVVKGASEDGRVLTAFEILHGDQERITEVADMLGLDDTVAGELLRSAQRWRSAGFSPTKATSSSSGSQKPMKYENKSSSVVGSNGNGLLTAGYRDVRDGGVEDQSGGGEQPTSGNNSGYITAANSNGNGHHRGNDDSGSSSAVNDGDGGDGSGGGSTNGNGQSSGGGLSNNISSFKSANGSPAAPKSSSSNSASGSSSIGNAAGGSIGRSAIYYVNGRLTAVPDSNVQHGGDGHSDVHHGSSNAPSLHIFSGSEHGILAEDWSGAVVVGEECAQAHHALQGSAR